MLHFPRGLLVCVLCVCVSVRLSDAGAWLVDPPGRSAMWNYGINSPVNENFRNLNCGGEPVEVQADGTRNCGICGDAVTDELPRGNENGGRYYPAPVLSRYYTAGQTAEVRVRNDLPAIHGYYEFRLCPDGERPTQSCLDGHLLAISDAGNMTYIRHVTGTPWLLTMHVHLPPEVTCAHCLLQWRFRTENTYEGCDANNWCGVGRGPQIEYYNCADVAIGAVGEQPPGDIQEPTYGAAGGDSVDHSASATQRPGSAITTPAASGLATTHRPVTRPAIPTSTSPPAGLTSARPALVTDNPVLTIQPLPVTATTPQVTNSGGSKPTMAAIVIVDAGTGNAIHMETFGGSRNIANRQLLMLLGLLPVLGAARLTRRPPPLAPVHLGTGARYGNLGMAVAANGGNPGQLLHSYSGSMGTSGGYTNTNTFGTNGYYRKSLGMNNPILVNQGKYSPIWSNSNSATNMVHTNGGQYIVNTGTNTPNTFGNHGSVITSELNSFQNNVKRPAINGNFGKHFGNQNVLQSSDINIGNNIQSPSFTSGSHVFNRNSANLLSMRTEFNRGTSATDNRARVTSEGEHTPNNGVTWGRSMHIPPAGNFNRHDNHQQQMYPQQIQHNSQNNNINVNHLTVPNPTQMYNTGWHGNGWKGNNGRQNSNINYMNTQIGEMFPGHTQTGSMPFPAHGQMLPSHPVRHDVIRHNNGNNVNTNTNGGNFFPAQQQTHSLPRQGHGQILHNHSVKNTVIQPALNPVRQSLDEVLQWNTNSRVNSDTNSGPNLGAGHKPSRTPQVHELYHQLVNSPHNHGNQWNNQHPGHQGAQLDSVIPQRAM